MSEVVNLLSVPGFVKNKKRIRIRIREGGGISY